MFNSFQHYSTFFRGWPAKTKKISLPTKDHKIAISVHFWAIWIIFKKSGVKIRIFFHFCCLFFPHYGKKEIFFSTLWKKKTIFQIPPNDKSTFHNVVTIEQSYMFNIHFATQSGILKILTEIHFLTPTRSGILYLASPCYASLRSDSAICFALYKIPELLGVKKRISLSTKRIPLFVANDIEQSIIDYRDIFVSTEVVPFPSFYKRIAEKGDKKMVTDFSIWLCNPTP